MSPLATLEHPPSSPRNQAAPPSSVHQESFQEVVDFAGGTEIARVWWFTQLNLKSPRTDVRCLPAATRICKRALDVVIAASMLVLLAPVLLLVAALVKLTSRGPVIFRQTRVGLNLRRPGVDRRQRRDEVPHGQAERRRPGSDRRTEFTYGRHFTLYKFRTMRTDAEKQGARFAVKGDPRVTSIGRLLRKTRVDELPQLWNVLKGEMSLVGPRPERPEFIKTLSDQIPSYLDRLGLQPGLTGVAQILNGYDNEIESFRRKVAFDLHYLQNCSVWNDFKILVRTIGVVLTGSGAL
jgi:lipopolysaccharide/colanic/teichoic acid biosynthesis glycosyltransferase